jgi:hypothetical protein
MQESNVNQELLEDDVDQSSVEMYIDELIEMLQEQKKELGVDAISIYVDEYGGISMELFDSKSIDTNGAEA